MSSTSSQDLAALVEQTALPRIAVRTRGKQTRYHAYVNGYICGPPCRVKDTRVVPLYYLSLVGMAGEGARLQGVWSALASEPPQDVYLDGVGTVVLAHHDPGMQDLHYRLHWNYCQQSTRAATPVLHAVIESHMLTLCDPQAGAAPARRASPSSRGTHQPQRKPRAERAVQLATVRKEKELGALAEELQREKHPLFLLLVPGSVAPLRLPDEPEALYTVRRSQAIRTYLAGQHFAFLDRRVPWAMSSAWADFLWQRAVALQEVTPLTSWVYEAIQRADADEGLPLVSAEGDVGPRMPLFCDAWLCRPESVRLARDLTQALRNGRISRLRDPDASPREVHPQLVSSF